MGRPRILPKKKKDGWYIEIRNKGSKSGIVLIRNSHEEMMQTARQYKTTKDIILMGQYINGKRVEQPKVSKAKGRGRKKVEKEKALS